MGKQTTQLSGFYDFVASFTPHKLIATCVRLLAHPSRFLATIRSEDWAGISTPAGFLVASVTAALCLSIFVPPLDSETRWSHVIGDLQDEEAAQVLRCLGIVQSSRREVVVAEMINPLASPYSKTVREKVGSVHIERVIAFIAASDSRLGERLATRARYTRARREIVATFVTIGVAIAIFAAAFIMHLMLRSRGERYRSALYPLIYLRCFWIIAAVAIIAAYDQLVMTDIQTRAAVGAAINAALFVVMVVQFTWAFRVIYGRSVGRTIGAVLVGKVASLLTITILGVTTNAAAGWWLSMLDTP